MKSWPRGKQSLRASYQKRDNHVRKNIIYIYIYIFWVFSFLCFFIKIVLQGCVLLSILRIFTDLAPTGPHFIWFQSICPASVRIQLVLPVRCCRGGGWGGAAAPQGGGGVVAVSLVGGSWLRPLDPTVIGASVTKKLIVTKTQQHNKNAKRTSSTIQHKNTKTNKKHK